MPERQKCPTSADAEVIENGKCVNIKLKTGLYNGKGILEQLYGKKENFKMPVPIGNPKTVTNQGNSYMETKKQICKIDEKKPASIDVWHKHGDNVCTDTVELK